MKIYKRSLWKTGSIWFGLLAVVTMFTCFVLSIINPRSPDWLPFYYAAMFFPFTAIFLTMYSYVVITPDKFSVKNIFYSFWGADFALSNIEKVEIGNAGGYTRNYIRVFTPGKKSRRYVIELVNPKEYRYLIDDLKNRGIKVETTRITLK